MALDTLIDGIDYGPLAVLIGTWKGEKGVDRAPEPDGEERNPFYETILYEPIGDVDNAQKQNLVVLRYHQVVSRKSNDKVFHNETGYWSYDRVTGVIMQSLTIPRGLSLLAGGWLDPRAHEADEVIFQVEAKAGDVDWGIVESPFMRDNATTRRFTHRISVKGDEMTYTESTFLHIYGKDYEHIDLNRLRRV